MAAACVSSMLASVFEAPTEMFKHRTQVSPMHGKFQACIEDICVQRLAICWTNNLICFVVQQAGLIQGRMLHNMSTALRVNGMGALYSGYLAFLMKSLPYDVAELVTYSELSRLQGPLQKLPSECRDILTGQHPYGQLSHCNDCRDQAHHLCFPISCQLIGPL